MDTGFAASLMPLYELRQLVSAASYVGCGNIGFRTLATRPEHCTSGSLYVPLRGSAHCTPAALKLARQNGACGLLTDLPVSFLDWPQCIVKDIRRTYGELCQKLAGSPARELQTVGVTGTNGKTTVCWMLRSILRTAGRSAGLLGTIEYDDGCRVPQAATLTTPDAATLAEWMRQMVQLHTTHLAMEVSSHALDQRRVAGLEFAMGIVTNLTRDHLDYHADFAHYVSAKAQLANYLRPDAPLILWGDDPEIRGMAERFFAARKCLWVGCGPHNDVIVQPTGLTLTHSRGQILLNQGTLELTVPLPGLHNLINAALAATAANALGCDAAAIARGLNQFVPPPGRMQSVDAGQSFTCFVDYAHTPDAIRQVMKSLRPLVSGRMICLLGAGGDRDPQKRPEMGQAASEHADLIVLTADNSRNESTAAIIQDIRTGIPAGGPPIEIVPDRAAAIDRAVQLAEPGDCLILMGKGHEQTQQIGAETTDFDDVTHALRSIYRYCPHTCRQREQQIA